MSSLNPRDHLASSKARTFAYLIDLCASSMVLMPGAFATYCWGTSNVGGLQFSLLLFAYHLYFLVNKEGVSFGKYVMNIAVVSAAGRPLHVSQALIRSASLALPWLFISVDGASWLQTLTAGLSSSAIRFAGALWLTIDSLLIEYAIDRRSLSDRLASTVVVTLPPPQPHRAPAIPMFSGLDDEFGPPPKRPPQK